MTFNGDLWRHSAPLTLFAKFICTGALSFFTLSSQASAQIINCNNRLVTSLDFIGPTLISGTDLQVGATYRYDSVATGIDAEIEILGFTGGATLNFVDRDVGLVNYFQPELNASQNSSADFRITFLASGTNTPIEIDFAAGGIDIDGNNVSLREYAEFETTLVESLLSNPTELDMNASGPSASDRIRFESRTTLVATGIDPTATANIVMAFYTDTSSFEYRIGALGTGTQTRLTSLGFDCPNLQNPISIPLTAEDFGDAPFPTYGNPIHTIVNGIRLGAANTDDTGPYNSSTASADTGDDGVTIPAFVQTANATITANVVGTGGYLQGWIDWNGDGDFNDTDEQIAQDVQDTDNDGVIDIPVTVPASTTNGQTFARFRWSTTSGLESNTAVSDGEVEDYEIPSITEASVDLNAVKTVEVYDPANVGLYMTPGNEVLYKIIVTNESTSTVEAQDIDLSDTLPENVRFVSATTTGFTAGSFGSPALPTANTDCDSGACIIRYSGASLAIDTTGEVIVRALIK